MGMLKAIGSGLIGATVLTLVHESARRVIPSAPRLDVLGMRAIAKSMQALDQSAPTNLHDMALVGDLISNSLYYSLVAAGNREQALTRGAVLGLGAGLGALVLPGPLGLGRQPTERTPSTQLMTLGWYLAGGLAAAAAFRLMTGSSGDNT